MSYPKTGGPAFPQQHPDGSISHPGMDLRDWFAAKASEEDIQALLPETMGLVREFEKKHGFHPTRQWARYAHADRMITEKEKELP